MRVKWIRTLVLAGAVLLLPVIGCTDEQSVDVRVPEGTALVVALDDPLSSDGSRRGERFEAVLLEPLMVDAAIAVPAGARVRGALLDVRPASAVEGGGAAMSLVLEAIHVGPGPWQPIVTEPVRCVPQATAMVEATGIVVALAPVRGEIALRPGQRLRFETSGTIELRVGAERRTRAGDA